MFTLKKSRLGEYMLSFLEVCPLKDKLGLFCWALEATKNGQKMQKNPFILSTKDKVSSNESCLEETKLLLGGASGGWMVLPGDTRGDLCFREVGARCGLGFSAVSSM